MALEEEVLLGWAWWFARTISGVTSGDPQKNLRHPNFPCPSLLGPQIQAAKKIGLPNRGTDERATWIQDCIREQIALGSACKIIKIRVDRLDMGLEIQINQAKRTKNSKKSGMSRSYDNGKGQISNEHYWSL